jgi:hypothetical protein
MTFQLAALSRATGFATKVIYSPHSRGQPLQSGLDVMPKVMASQFTLKVQSAKQHRNANQDFEQLKSGCSDEALLSPDVRRCRKRVTLSFADLRLEGLRVLYLHRVPCGRKKLLRKALREAPRALSCINQTSSYVTPNFPPCFSPLCIHKKI